jgi:hypothetical protein
METTIVKKVLPKFGRHAGAFKGVENLSIRQTLIFL